MEEQKSAQIKKELPKSPIRAASAGAPKKDNDNNEGNNKNDGKPEPGKSKPMLALILIRGLTGTKTEIRATLDTLRLKKKHVCVVIEDNPSYRASAMKCKDYIAFGEIDEETYKQLVEKRGIKQLDGKMKKFFCLHPPRGGFERKGIKKPFTKGGALGYRGNKINGLIKKML